MPIKFVHILAAFLLFITACPNSHNSNAPLPHVTEVAYRETSGSVTPDYAWDELYTVSPAGLIFVRTGHSALTTVNTGTWTINSYGTNEATLFTALSGAAVYGVEKTGQGAPPIGEGIKDYIIHYDNGSTKEVIIGDGSIYNNAGLITTPTNIYIATDMLPFGASNRYKIKQMGGSLQGNPLNLTKFVTTLAGSEYVGSTDGIGPVARFWSPYGITTDGVNLYVADTYNNTIRKIIISSGVVSTLTGSVGIPGSTDGIGTEALFNFPWGITTDGTNLYVCDHNSHIIRKIIISSGVVSTVTGSAGVSGYTDGIGTAALFNSPHGITTDGINLYVADSWNNSIRKIVINSGEVTTLAGSVAVGSVDGIGPAARFAVPYGVTTDGASLYVADTGNSTIRKIDISSGLVSTLTGSAGIQGFSDGAGLAALFYSPSSITTDGTSLYVTDSGNGVIRKIVISSGLVTTFTGTGLTIGINDSITTDGTSLYITDNFTVRKIR